jgi:hypothetical protein
MGPGDRIEYGHHSHTHWEDDAVVLTTHRYHAGHEFVIESDSGLWKMAGA